MGFVKFILQCTFQDTASKDWQWDVVHVLFGRRVIATRISALQMLFTTFFSFVRKKKSIMEKHFLIRVSLSRNGEGSLGEEKRKDVVRLVLACFFFYKSYLVDPASSHMLVSKIKPCMSKYKQLCTVKLRMAH